MNRLIIVLAIAVWCVLLVGAYHVYAETYSFGGDTDICKDLCEDASGGFDLEGCQVHYPDGSDTADAVNCIYTNFE